MKLCVKGSSLKDNSIRAFCGFVAKKFPVLAHSCQAIFTSDTGKIIRHQSCGQADAQWGGGQGRVEGHIPDFENKPYQSVPEHIQALFSP